MKKDEEAAKVRAVCQRYGIPVPQNDADWKPLAMALMAAHEPEFQKPRRVGNKPKTNLVRRAMKQYGMTGRRACEFVWKRGGEHLWKCELETFRQNVSAVTKIAPDKLFSEEPNDKPVVKRFKRDFREACYRFGLVEQFAMQFAPDSAERKSFADIKTFDEKMLEIFNVSFLGEN